MPPDYRTLFREGLFAAMETWRVQFNATQTNDHNKIQQSKRARPPTFNPPLIYIGTVTEALTHSASTKGDILEGSVVVVRGIYDNEEAVQWREAAVWSLHEHISNNKNLVSAATLIEPTGTEDIELNMGAAPGGGEVIYVAGLVNVRLDIRFGRD